MATFDGYKNRLQDCISRLKAANESCFLHSVNQADFFAQAQRTLERLDKDIQTVKKSTAVLLPKLQGEALDHNAGAQLANLFRAWRNDPPSTAALFAVAMPALGIPPDAPYVASAFLTAIAADIDSDNAYHNRHHSREVCCAMIRLLHVHQKIDAPLSEKDLLLCLTAGAGHDLLHDGRGNMGVQYRLEDVAARALVPFLNAGDVSRDDAADLHAMIRATDVGILPGSISPSNALKRHASGQERMAPQGMARIFDNPRLAIMAGLLSDADLTPSGATDIAFSRLMSRCVSQENPAIPNTPAITGNFIEFIIGGQYTTKAGRATGQAALAHILTELQKNTGFAPTTP